MADNDEPISGLLTNEEMKIACFHEGYNFSWEALEHGGKTHKVVAPDLWRFSDWNHDTVVKKAYARLQKERQFEAMKALLEEVAGYEIPDFWNGEYRKINDYRDDSEESIIGNSNALIDFVDKAKALLGKAE